MHEILEILEQNPVVGAVRNEDDIKEVIKSNVEVVFILSGNLLNIKSMVDTIRSCGKRVCIHIDLIDGLGRDHAAVDFIKEHANPDGYITTKSSLAKYTKAQNLFTIHRLFIIDNHSLVTGIKNVHETAPDAVEVMPGIAVKLIERIKKDISVPIIAGGLISSKEDIIDSLSAGVLAVSTSCRELWNL